MFTIIRLDNFKSEVMEEKGPVFLACVRRDIEFKEQTEILENLSKRYGAVLKVCLLDEDFIMAFSEECEIERTPTFLIFDNGKEKNRMLGLADRETLEDFVLRTIDLPQKRN